MFSRQRRRDRSRRVRLPAVVLHAADRERSVYPRLPPGVAQRAASRGCVRSVAAALALAAIASAAIVAATITSATDANPDPDRRTGGLVIFTRWRAANHH